MIRGLSSSLVSSGKTPGPRVDIHYRSWYALVHVLIDSWWVVSSFLRLIWMLEDDWQFPSSLQANGSSAVTTWWRLSYHHPGNQPLSRRNRVLFTTKLVRPRPKWIQKGFTILSKILLYDSVRRFGNLRASFCFHLFVLNLEHTVG